MEGGALTFRALPRYDVTRALSAVLEGFLLRTKGCQRCRRACARAARGHDHVDTCELDHRALRPCPWCGIRMRQVWGASYAEFRGGCGRSAEIPGLQLFPGTHVMVWTI